MKDKIKNAVKRNVSAASLVFFAAGICFAALHLLFWRFSGFADGFNRSVGAAARFILAKATGWIPFSLAEALILFSPVALVCFIVLTVRRTKEGSGFRCAVSFVSLIPLIYSMFVLTFAAGYHAPRIEEKMGFSTETISQSDLEDAAFALAEKLNAACEDVSFVRNSSAVMPYSNGEMIERLNRAFGEFGDEYGLAVDFHAAVKQIALSVPMTYTHIAGVYTFFTGEANVNVNSPDSSLVFTTAHEMAHQRGIAREDEANFAAYLVCERSDDPFIRYSAYVNMTQYVLNALWSSDSDRYSDLCGEIDGRAIGDIRAYGEFYDEYEGHAISEISAAVNDAYLKSQGTDGVASYGKVVQLFVKYMKSDKCE